MKNNSNYSNNYGGAAYKKIIRTAIFIGITAVFCYGMDSKKTATKKIPAEGNHIAVVELFTSEGCSSCPPADELVRKLQAENKKDVYILSYHVDYWNRLGWKDNFSKPEFSNRQKQYSRYLSLDGVYTPQIVVNGTDQFVGSNETRLRSSLKTGSIQQPGLSIEASRINNSTIHVSYKLPEAQAGLVNIALVQPQASTSVKRGENGGKILHHVNIVRELKVIEALSNTGSVDIELNEELLAVPLQVIAYTQNKKDFKITGAVQTQIVVRNENISK